MAPFIGPSKNQYRALTGIHQRTDTMRFAHLAARLHARARPAYPSILAHVNNSSPVPVARTDRNPYGSWR